MCFQVDLSCPPHSYNISYHLEYCSGIGRYMCRPTPFSFCAIDCMIGIWVSFVSVCFQVSCPQHHYNISYHLEYCSGIGRYMCRPSQFPFCAIDRA